MRLNHLDENFSQVVSQSFNKAANSYNKFASLQLKIAQALTNMINVREYKSLLDLGCGTGYISKLIGEKVIQLDIAFNMCKLAKLNGPLVVNSAMEHLPFKDNSIDLVTSSLALQWSYNMVKTLLEIFRVMRDGGKLFISVPVNKTFCEFNHILQLLNSPIIEFLKFNNILDAIIKAGFTIDDISHISVLKENHKSFIEFIQSMKMVGANINKNKNIIGRKLFNSIEEMYKKKFATDKGIIVSWHIGYIVAQK